MSFKLNGLQSSITPQSVFRDGRQETTQSMLVECHFLPLCTMVSRLLSSPYGPTFHLSLALLHSLSDRSLYLALEGAYLLCSYYTLKQYYCSSVWIKTTGVSPSMPTCSKVICLNSSHTHNSFRIQARLLLVRSPLLEQSHFDFFSWTYWYA